MTVTIDDIARYYADCLRRFGATPAGVDWRDGASQRTRFEQLSKIFDAAGGAVLDLGCGYGAMLEFLREKDFAGDYAGLDVAAEMIAAARERYSGDPRARFTVGSRPGQATDYVVASGIFNVRTNRSDAEWRAHVEDTLIDMDRFSRRGFAFNCLTSYSDPDRMREYLYYGDPCYYFDLCKRRFSRQVALLHDYGLYEFTVIVRKG
jgi:ubiquinone/menaquinone biosynthesis C-methylase UbiE